MHDKDLDIPELTNRLGLRARLGFYSVNLFCGVIQLILGVVGALSTLRWAFNRNSVAFSVVAAVAGLFAIILHSILLAFCNRPASTHLFSKAKFHSYSLAGVGLFWIVVGIMFITIFPTNCDLDAYSDGLASLWCSWSIGEAIFSFTGAVLIFLPAYMLYAPMRSKGYTMNMNVAA